MHKPELTEKYRNKLINCGCNPDTMKIDNLELYINYIEENDLWEYDTFVPINRKPEGK